MKHGTHEAWMLLPGDKLADGRIVRECTEVHGHVLVSFEGAHMPERMGRNIPVEVNRPN